MNDSGHKHEKKPANAANGNPSSHEDSGTRTRKGAPTVPGRPTGAERPSPTLDRRFFIRLGLQTGGVLLAGVLVLLALAGAQQMGWLSSDVTTAAGPGESGGTIYTCPMHPQIRQPNPGRCPICGMKLEAVSESEGGSKEEYAVNISPVDRRLSGIETATVERKSVHQTIETVGRIDLDESRMATIAAYVDGRVERLFADYTGVRVAKRDHLVRLYSPQLYSAQVEYLQSRQALKQMGDRTLQSVRKAQQSLVSNSRQKLVELGMTDEQIKELEKSGEAQSRLTIYTPIGGTVTEKKVVEGQYVDAGEPIYRVANLSTVWLMLELYPEDAAKIRFGQQVEAEVRSMPGEVFVGRVAFIDPVVDPQNRTVGVRVELLNEEGLLRPGDYASARVRVPIGEQGRVYDADLAGKWISPMHPQVIRDEPGQCPICGMDLVPTSEYGYTEEPIHQPQALVVPRSAVLRAGENSVVYAETEPGRFEIRPVTLGPLMEDEVVIVRGVQEGEKVATSGNFLIDSQMQLEGKPSLIDPERAEQRMREGEGQQKDGPPLSPEDGHVHPLAGKAGESLEKLYGAYFEVQRSLAEDRTVPRPAVDELQSAALELKNEAGLPDKLQPLLQRIVEDSAGLHEKKMEEARRQFRPLSHAIVRLAFRVRGKQAEQPFVHFHCPMAKPDGGDWLQAKDDIANPYFGSQMLKCGWVVHKLPLAGKVEQGGKKTR